MQLVLYCYNFGLITVKSILLGRNTLTFIQIPLLYPFGNDPLLMEIQSNDTCDGLIITGLYSNHVEAFVQFVGRIQMKYGNLWLKTGSYSASFPILASRDFAMSGKFFPLPAKWKHRFAWRRSNYFKIGQGNQWLRPSSATCDFCISHGTANSARCTSPAALPWFSVSVRAYREHHDLNIRWLLCCKSYKLCCMDL